MAEPTKRKKSLVGAKEWVIPCKVTLDGARMVVTAATREEAEAKARKNEWNDIQYAQAEMTDWEPYYEDIEENN